MRSVRESKLSHATSAWAQSGLLAMAAWLFPAVAVAQNAPALNSLSFSPNTINVGSADQNVVVNWSASDSLGIYYVEVGFVDASGANFRRGCAAAAGAVPGCGSFSGGTSVTSTVNVAFPKFTPGGTWTIGYVLLFDTSFNVTLLGPLGFAPLPSDPGPLQVTSVVDTAPPAMTAFTLSANSIDTTAASVSVNANFTLTDDVTGAVSWQLTFTSPSGLNTVDATVNVTTGCTTTGMPPVSTCTAQPITFPRLSEAGTWTITSVVIVDAAGNTVELGTTDLTNSGFATTVTVASTADTTPPVLSSNLTFTPGTVNVTSSSATVTVGFSASDPAPNPSGVTGFTVGLVSPSGNFTLSATKTFASTPSISSSATFLVPQGSELGNWTVAFVNLVDAAGNTATLTSSPAGAFPFLVVTSQPVDTPVIVPTVNPAPNAVGWNTTSPVTLSWSVSDPGPATITTTSGCGTITLSAETSGNTFTCSATNSANISKSVSITIRIDLTPPVVTPNVSPAANGAGWNNTNTNVSWSLSDSISGINFDQSSCDPVALTAETGGTILTCTAVNGAGLSTTVSVTIKIDKTPPTTVATIAPAPNGAGWNNTNVTVTFTGSDALSGIASCTAPITLTSEGAGQSASGVCTDVAGNVSAPVTASGINIDKTAPVASGTKATPNPVQINTGTTITSNVTDTGGSHIASVQYNVDGGGFTALSGPFGTDSANISITIAPFTATGIHKYCVQGIDVAGNVGNLDCVIVAVFDPNGGFATGGGQSNSPAGADLANPTTSGTLVHGFNFKYLPGSTTPTGNLEVQYQAGNLDFKSTGLDYLVITSEPRAQVQGTGTINGGLVCKFQLDAWAGSFQPGNVDALGLTIFNCSDGSNRFNLPTAPVKNGKIQIHQ